MMKSKIEFKPEELKEYPYLDKLEVGLGVIGLEGDMFEGMKGEIIQLNYTPESRETENGSIIEIVVSFTEMSDVLFKKNFAAHYESKEDVSIDYVIMDEETIGFFDFADGFNYKTLKGEVLCTKCGKVLPPEVKPSRDKITMCPECEKIKELFDKLNVITYNSYGADSELKKYDGQRCFVLGYQLDNVDINEVGLMFKVKMTDGNIVEAFLDELHVKDLDIEGKDINGFRLFDHAVFCGADSLLNDLTFEEAEECGRKVAQSEICCEEKYFLLYVSEMCVFNNKTDFITNANISSPTIIIELSTGKIVQFFNR